VSDPCRIGAVEFLNAAPLLRGLADTAGLEVTCDSPSALAEGLSEGRFDVALIPIASYLQGVGGSIVPGVSISSCGPAGTIKLYSKVPLPEVRTLALDRSSRSSAGLAQAMLSARYGARPEAVRMAPDLDRMLAEADAALVIGHAWLLTERPPEAVVVALDLGEVWWEWQGLPLVLAAWVFREGYGSPEVAQALVAARDAGLAEVDAVASQEAARHGIDEPTTRRYLAEMLDYDLGPEHLRGIEAYRELLLSEGLLTKRRELTLFE